jgi:hypothetical protein
VVAGELAEAEWLAARSVALSRGSGLPWERVMALNTFAEVLLATRDLVDARTAIRKARELVDAEPV